MRKGKVGLELVLSTSRLYLGSALKIAPQRTGNQCLHRMSFVTHSF